MPANPRSLRGIPPAEVPLSRAPLARVIAQVRYPPILAIRTPEKVAVFQEAVRKTYSILSEERIHHIVTAPGGTPDVREGVVWRFSDSDNSPQWRVSLSIDFVALETSAYISRQDFLDRLRVVLLGLEEAFKPAEARRIGLRYIDRLTGDAVDRIAQLVRPKVLGIIRQDDEPPVTLGGAVIRLLTEALLLAEEGHIQARWGKLPANMTYDPDALEAVENPSWILDLDMFSSRSQAFVSDNVLATTTTFAQRIYMVFREMITDEFIKFYGGEL